MHPSSRYISILLNQFEIQKEALQQAKKIGIFNDAVKLSQVEKWFEQAKGLTVEPFDEELFKKVKRTILPNLTFKVGIHLMVLLDFNDSQIEATFKVSGYQTLNRDMIKLYKSLFCDMEFIEDNEEFERFVKAGDFKKFNDLIISAYYRPDIGLLYKLGLMPPVDLTRITEATNALTYARLLYEIRSNSPSVSLGELMRLYFASEELKGKLESLNKQDNLTELANFLRSTIKIELVQDKDIDFETLLKSEKEAGGK